MVFFFKELAKSTSMQCTTLVPGTCTRLVCTSSKVIFLYSFCLYNFERYFETAFTFCDHHIPIPILFATLPQLPQHHHRENY